MKKMSETIKQYNIFHISENKLKCGEGGKKFEKIKINEVKL